MQQIEMDGRAYYPFELMVVTCGACGEVVSIERMSDREVLERWRLPLRGNRGRLICRRGEVLSRHAEAERHARKAST